MEKIKHSWLPDGRKKYDRIPVAEYPSKVVLGIQEDYCNLACPMCMVHGTNKEPSFNIKDVAAELVINIGNLLCCAS